MDFVSAKDIADRWRISVRRVQKLCDDGRVPGAVRFGRAWMIPESAEKPVDPRNGRPVDERQVKENAANRALPGQHKPPRKETGTGSYGQAVLSANDDEWTSEAMMKYWRVKDYRRLLSLDLSRFVLTQAWTPSFSMIALDIAQNCPAVVKKEFPLSMLRIAWSFLNAGLQTEFESLMRELRVMLREKSVAPELSGEWMLLMSLNNKLRVGEMLSLVREAEPLFVGKVSRVIFPEAPWRFGDTAVLSLFHTAEGEADKEADELQQYIGIYSRLTNGHGSGADALFRANFAYHRGDIAEAEILAHKATFLAESRQQSIVQLGAAILLGQIALQKSDAAGYRRALESIERVRSYPTQSGPLMQAVLDISRGALLLDITYTERIEGWLQRGEFPDWLLRSPTFPNALFVFVNCLIHRGESTRVIGVLQGIRSEMINTHPYMDILLSFNEAIGHIRAGNRGKAAVLVKHAAARALPDGILYPLVAYSWVLDGLVDEVLREKYPEFLEEYERMKARFIAGWMKLRKDMLPAQLPANLTEREYEVAQLAASGFRNREIAARLSVTESTVRTHLRTAFQKLDVDRRARLSEKLKQA